MKASHHINDLVAIIPDGATLMIGGFFGVGSPHRLIQGLASSGRKGLTIIANDTDYTGRGIGKLIEARAVKRLVASHIGANSEGCDYSLRLLNQWRSRLLQNELGIWTGSGKGSIRLSPSGTFRGGHNLRDDLA